MDLMEDMWLVKKEVLRLFPGCIYAEEGDEANQEPFCFRENVDQLPDCLPGLTDELISENIFSF